MKNPEKQLKEYLEKLIFRFLYIRSLHKQVLLISEWERPDRIVALKIGSHFFELTLYSFRRTIILELCKFLSEKEDKSLFDWLEKLKQNVKALKPSVYNPEIKTNNSREILKSEEYLKIIQGQINEIHKYDKIINLLKKRRDKEIAHNDRTYFDNPKKLHELFPITHNEISLLLNVIDKILRKHYNLLFQADISLEVFSGTDIKTILTYIRAFDRVCHDKRITKDCGIRVVEYKKDIGETEQYF